MTQRNDGGPAFPFEEKNGDGTYYNGTPGMPLRQYAAIKLRVPDSGTDWLDDMIRQSLRDDVAAKAMQGWVWDSEMRADDENIDFTAKFAYRMADAMLAARERT